MDYETMIEKFIKYQKDQNRSINTIKAYRNTLQECFIEYLKEKPLNEITFQELQGFKTYKEDKAIKRQKTGIQGQGAGAFLKTKNIQSTTINRHISAIKQFLIFNNESKTAKEIKVLKIQKKFDTIEYEDIQKVFDVKTLEDYYTAKVKKISPERLQFYIDRMKLLLDFDLAHGLRLQEVVDLNKTDLKLERKIPVVEVTGKGNKQREVYLSPTWLKHYEEYIKKYAANLGKTNKIFTNYNGGALSYSTFRTYVKTLGYYINVPRLSFHKLRHCYAIKRYESDKDIVALSKALGHDGVQTTMIYLSRIGFRNEKQVDILDSSVIV